MTKTRKYGEHRGKSFLLVGVSKGLGITSLNKYNIVDALKSRFGDRNSTKALEGALFGFDYLHEKLGHLNLNLIEKMG